MIHDICDNWEFDSKTQELNKKDDRPNHLDENPKKDLTLHIRRSQSAVVDGKVNTLFSQHDHLISFSNMLLIQQV
jgi:hypothetical protein